MLPSVTALAYAGCTVIWGSTWMAIKFGLDGVPPYYGAGLRFVIAAAVLWAMILVSGRRKPLSARGQGEGAHSHRAGYAPRRQEPAKHLLRPVVMLESRQTDQMPTEGSPSGR